MSYKIQFYVAMFSIVLIVMLSGLSYNVFFSYKYKKEAFIQESILQASLIAGSSVAPLMFFDKDGMETALKQLSNYENILQVVVYDKDEKVFSRYNPENRAIPKQKDEKTSWFLDDSASFVVKDEVSVNGVDYGSLYLEKNSSVLSEFLRNVLVNATIFSLTLLMIMLFLTTKLSDKLLSPIIELSNKLVQLSQLQNYETRLTYDSDNEIGKLYGAFNNLFISIGIHQKSRDKALEKATSYQKHLENLTNELEQRVEERTKELQNSIAILQKAQNQLVESEKMAALGSLVSGVAHEVNTPLGNAVTGSSIIKNECKELLMMMNDGTLKKSTLDKKLSHIDETSRLLSKSVSNAADLIKSFKKISIDQSVEGKREFDLHEYINEVAFTFHNKLKQIPVDVEVTPKEVLKINSYPGVFAQLFNNFIQNSIIHGFENFNGVAKITINISIKDDYLYIVYSDNGNGVKKEIKDKVFEPFITTKRNAGGTGLGLNIVYNIIAQKLKGEVNLESEEGKGTKFNIKIPLDVQ